MDALSQQCHLGVQRPKQSPLGMGAQAAGQRRTLGNEERWATKNVAWETASGHFVPFAVTT
ncbi:MAG: hypothetical protein WBF05_14755 [Anaerolineales bacterium]